jgi:arylsulfatase
MDGRTELTVFPGMVYMAENAFINMKNTSFELAADVEITQGKNHGVLLAQGGRFGGWAFWVNQGKPAFSYNFLGLELFQVQSMQSITDGKHTIRAVFEYDGKNGARGAGGTIHLFDGPQKIGQGRIEKTQANVFSLDDTADTGTDTGTGVDPEYGEGSRNAFSGKLNKVKINLR